MVRLSTQGTGPQAGDLTCDNYPDCGEWLAYVTTSFDRARAKGWHVYQGETSAGVAVTWILGPVCVGKRARLSIPPKVLPGQEELF